MKLSPLRKQVESLNKELESQNIQIKDLIGFLNKSTPKQKPLNIISPRNYLAKISQKKQNTNLQKNSNHNSQVKTTNKQNRDRQSFGKQKGLNPSHSINDTVKKINGSKQIPLTKSVTFHNIQNALTTRRYLKLSRPQKKLNNSCTFCRQSVTLITSTPINQHKEKKINPSSQSIQNLKHHQNIQSIKKQFKSLQKVDGKYKLKSDSKSKKKTSEKETPRTQKKKNPLKQLQPNQILSKKQIKNFFEKKSLPLSNSTKNKTKLSLKDQKSSIVKIKDKK